MDERIPVVGVDYPRTHQQLVAWFCPEEDCLEYLARLRWPGGFVCPACGGDKSWRTARRGMWMCSGCGRQTSVTAGTIFHRSHTPLTTWFAAIWFVCASRNGVSATTLQQVLGFGSYETAWAWLHKLRRVMVRPDRELLAGVVELDETMVGGRTKRAVSMQQTKVPIMVAVETPGAHRLGRIRLARATAKTSDQLVTSPTRSSLPAHTSAPTVHATYVSSVSRASPTSTGYCSPQPSRPRSTCPGSTWPPRCSSAGSPAPCTTASPHGSWTTTSPSSPSGSTAAPPAPAACCSIGSSNKPWPPTPTP